MFPIQTKPIQQWLSYGFLHHLLSRIHNEVYTTDEWLQPVKIFAPAEWILISEISKIFKAYDNFGLTISTTKREVMFHLSRSN